MKRLLLSLIGGFLIPFIYSAVVGPLTPYISNRQLDKLAMLPVRWPIMIIDFFFPLWFTIISLENEQEIWFFVYFVVCNVVLYSAITYVLLSLFWKRKPAPVASPPQPPQFETR